MATDADRELSANRKRRGVIHASITRLDGRVTEFEAKEELSPGPVGCPPATAQARNVGFGVQVYHLAVVDFVGEEALGAEQAILVEHDDRVADLTTRIQ